eukprot:360136-Chlamydomonas_euryale.AAC.7
MLQLRGKVGKQRAGCRDPALCGAPCKSTQSWPTELCPASPPPGTMPRECRRTLATAATALSTAARTPRSPLTLLPRPLRIALACDSMECRALNCVVGQAAGSAAVPPCCHYGVVQRDVRRECRGVAGASGERRCSRRAALKPLPWRPCLGSMFASRRTGSPWPCTQPVSKKNAHERAKPWTLPRRAQALLPQPKPCVVAPSWHRAASCGMGSKAPRRMPRLPRSNRARRFPCSLFLYTHTLRAAASQRRRAATARARLHARWQRSCCTTAIAQDSDFVRRLCGDDGRAFAAVFAAELGVNDPSAIEAAFARTAARLTSAGGGSRSVGHDTAQDAFALRFVHKCRWEALADAWLPRSTLCSFRCLSTCLSASRDSQVEAGDRGCNSRFGPRQPPRRTCDVAVACALSGRSGQERLHATLHCIPPPLCCFPGSSSVHLCPLSDTAEFHTASVGTYPASAEQ